jgi:hypothetical protein
VPTVSTVAAKCTLRTIVSGSVTALLSSLISEVRGLRPDSEAEIALGAMGIYR